MGLIDLLLKRKKETEDAANEYDPTKDDLQAQLEKAEKERDRRYAKQPPKEEKK